MLCKDRCQFLNEEERERFDDKNFLYIKDYYCSFYDKKLSCQWCGFLDSFYATRCEECSGNSIDYLIKEMKQDGVEFI